MLSNDVLCRAAVYPRFLNGDLFDIETLMAFSGRGPNVRSLSLASFWLCRGEEGVHRYGRQVAIEGNRRRKENNSNYWETSDQYLGYYSMRYGRVSSVGTREVCVRVYWKPENGVDEHFQLDAVPCIEAISARVDEAIQKQMSDGKVTQRPNRQKRIEKEVSREVRMIRAKLVEYVFGPTLEPVERTDARSEMQTRFMPVRPEK